MRINELTGYKNNNLTGDITSGLQGLHGRPDEWLRRSILEEFLSKMEDRGFRKLGNGAFGAVLTHPGIDYAIKVFKNDPAYLAFVKYALANQGNPALPKFRGKFMKLGGDYYVVRMELLNGVPTSPLIDAEVGILRYCAEGDMIGLKDHSPSGIVDFLSKNLKSLIGFVPSSVAPEIVLRALDDFSNNMGVLKCVLDLREMTKDNARLNMDINHDNLMLRGGQQLVLIDPFWDHMVVG